MTDAHCHVRRGESRHFLCDPLGSDPCAGDAVFAGRHPWDFLSGEAEPLDVESLRKRLAGDRALGVGEIGLDRLKSRTIPEAMRKAFAEQLALASEFRRPVVLHGAKCWGEVVAACRPFADRIPAFLFHGFSRSGGLIPEIVRMNGFVSIGPALLNDHAVNYRQLAKAIPMDSLLVESDATAESALQTPSVVDVATRLAGLRGLPLDVLEARLEANAERFLSPNCLPI